MANHVRNIVKMQGIGSLPLYTEVECAKPGSTVEIFDFNKIIPMPESLNLDSGSVEDMTMEAALKQIAAVINTRSCPPFHVSVEPSPLDAISTEDRIRASGMTYKEAGERGLQYLENIIKHGSSSWYYWRIDNWGTKWNSYDLERIDDDTIAFNTAWSNPGPIIEALSAQYPDLMIEHWWADEDVGQNTGYRFLQDGIGETDEPDGGSPDALELYVKCWGMDDCLRRDENGNLCFAGEVEGEDGDSEDVDE